MRRILFLTTVPTTLRAFLLPFAEHYRRQGWRVAAGASNLLADGADIHGVFDEVFDIPWNRSPLSATNLKSIRVLQQLIRLREYDIVHVHTPVASLLARYALRKFRDKTKVVYTAHGFHFGHDGKSPLFNPFYHAEMIAARWTDALVVINKTDLATADSRGLIEKRRLKYIPGIGIDLSRFRASLVDEENRLARRHEIGIGKSDFLLLMIAEFNPGKRHRDLLAALRCVPNHVHVAFAGDGRLFEEIKSETYRSSVRSRVHFLGFQRDIRSWIAASDAFVLPSAREGLPRSVMEAMAMGKLVIGSQIRGIDELLSDNCGMLFPVGDIALLAERIVTAVHDAEASKSCVRNALVKIQQYSLERVIAEHDQIYEELFSPSSERSAVDAV